MSPALIQRRRLEFQYRKDGIPTATPQMPKHLFPSVPSILCMQHRNPILGYSKAPWGLSVLSRVTGIFTGTTISPGGLLRQCPNHYAFHAGQNLPDKEFRYLRTVIVTAAVHWGFDSMLAHLLLTFQHRAGVSSYTSSFDLAQTCVFGKQLLGPILCGSISGAPLLPKLRGNFAEFLNECSHLRLRIFSSPTCVGLRYGYPDISLEAFLGSVASTTLCPCGLALAPQDNDPPDFPSGSPYRPQPGALRPSPGSYSLLRPPIVITMSR